MFMFVMPLGVLAVAYNRFSEAAIIATLTLVAALNFLCRYEFTPLFSLLVILPCLAFDAGEDFRIKLRKSVCYFLATVFGFFIAVVLHVAWVAADLDSTIAHAFSIAFESARLRTMSQEGVPSPLSFQFIRTIAERMIRPGFILPINISTINLSVPKGIILIALGGMSVVYLRAGSFRQLALFAWGITAYSCWYILGYQHIMWHAAYDYWLFSLSIGLVMILECRSWIGRIG
jgi:hypothetical protein